MLTIPSDAGVETGIKRAIGVQPLHVGATGPVPQGDQLANDGLVVRLDGQREHGTDEDRAVADIDVSRGVGTFVVYDRQECAKALSKHGTATRAGQADGNRFVGFDLSIIHELKRERVARLAGGESDHASLRFRRQACRGTGLVIDQDLPVRRTAAQDRDIHDPCAFDDYHPGGRHGDEARAALRGGVEPGQLATTQSVDELEVACDDQLTPGLQPDGVEERRIIGRWVRIDLRHEIRIERAVHLEPGQLRAAYSVK